MQGGPPVMGQSTTPGCLICQWGQSFPTLPSPNVILRAVRIILPDNQISQGSVAGEYAYPGGSVYAASKAFVKHFALAIRSDLQGKNVRVTDIEPGLTETEFSVVRFKGDEEKAGNVYAGTKAMTAEDIAESIFWATSLPEHVNINKIQLMATTQAIGPFIIHREG